MQQQQHIIQELTLQKLVQSPFVCQLYSIFQDKNYIYSLLEYLPNGEFFEYLRQVEKIPENAAKFYAAEILLALEDIHKQGIVYRDLKPENIVFDQKLHLKLIDFGFCKQIKNNLTFTLVGTKEYLAPEVIKQDQGYHYSCDWWALGILIYEMIAGEVPFYNDNVNIQYNMVLSGQIYFTDDFSDNAKDLILQLLNTDKDKRLGANQENGVQQIKNHPFFQGIKWKALYKKLIKAPQIQIIKDPQQQLQQEDVQSVLQEIQELKYSNVQGDERVLSYSQEQIDQYFSYLN